MMFRKLRNKFLFLNMTVTSLVLLTAFGIVYLKTANNVRAENERKLYNAAGSFVSIQTEEITPGQSLVLSGAVTSDYSPSFIIVTDDYGTVLSVNSFISLSQAIYTQAAEIAMNPKSPAVVELSGRKWIYNSIQMQATFTGHGLEQTFLSRWQISFLDVTESLKTLNDLLMTFLLVGIATLAIIFFVSTLYANRAIRPISESWEKQKRFVADASHELKTPLTTIMTNCDALIANENETVKSQREWLDYIQIGADRMSRLVGGLLTLARVEGMNVPAEKRSFDMGALVRDVAQSFYAPAQSKGLTVEQAVDIGENIYGCEDFVRQVFTILFDNAVKYAGNGGRVHISARRSKKGIVCSVKNTGGGITAGDLPHVFDRFYRSDTVRGGEDGSYGLGLSIAKSIMEQLGGTITARSVPGQWTEVAFAFWE